MPTELPQPGPSARLAAGPLRLHASRRFLEHADGTPFFWLGDTAWELFHRCRREEIEDYLERRRQQRFTVIQAVALAEFDGTSVPNAYGHLPLVDRDPARPDVRPEGEADYWKHVDFAFDAAAKRGLYIGLVPTWGDKMGPRAWGRGPEMFDEASARAFGRFLGTRYGGRENLVWIVGGDRPVLFEGRDFRALWRALAEGIRETDAGRHLMTYHPPGGESSSLFFHDEPWLDFNFLQSGHWAAYDNNYDMVAADYGRLPLKPVIDGEPRYEDHPINFQPERGYFDDFDVRNAAYWALFAGACGHTYGCHPIWQFLDETRTPLGKARRPWRLAIDLDGAWDMMHARALLESRPFFTRIPDQSLIAEGQGTEENHVQATRDVDGTYAFLYVPSGRKVVVNLARLRAATRVRVHWWSPRTGEVRAEGEREVVWGKQKLEFQPPDRPGRGNDWVLVLDDAAAGYPPPGTPPPSKT